MSDHPLYECAKDASVLIESGAIVHQKFTCSRCKARQTIAEANRFFTRGQCEECHHITDLELTGCNYLVIWDKFRVRDEDKKS
jgi:hypothetical protein